MVSEFRQYLYPEGHPRIESLKGLDAWSYRPVAERDAFTGGLIEGWRPLYRNEFHGVTSDGTVVADLYRLEAPEPSDRAPVEAMVAAAEHLLALLTEEQRGRIAHDVDAVEWQTWANPEFMQFDTGLRMESLGEEVRDAMTALVAASTSERGCAAIRSMMRINGFLGDLVGLPGIMNEYSYNFALYGTPHHTAPWGWQLYGHHCAVNCLVVDGQQVISPVFLGAEPNEIDAGPHTGTSVLVRRIELGRELMSLLTEEQRQRATTYREMVDEAMPAGRVHPGDERHLAGAFQDNRVIPYEGIRGSELSEQACSVMLQILEEFHLQPAGPLRRRMAEIAAHLDDTWFSWIGGHGPEDVFYYRVQSPVVIAELDHHCGVFLDYDTPKQFHVHTVLRTPNGNDYGRELVRQWQEAQADAKVGRPDR